MPSKAKPRVAYRPAKGAHLSREDAQLLGETFERLRVRHGGGFTPEDLVAEAKRKASPIHHLWEWSVHKAAVQAWIERAKYLTRSVVLCEVTIRSRTVQNVRAVVSIVGQRSGDDVDRHFYHSTPQALANKGLRRQVIQQALREFIALREKYKVFVELSRLLDAVDRERRRWKL